MLDNLVRFMADEVAMDGSLGESFRPSADVVSRSQKDVHRLGFEPLGFKHVLFCSIEVNDTRTFLDTLTDRYSPLSRNHRMFATSIHLPRLFGNISHPQE